MKIQDEKYQLKKEKCHLNKILFDNLFTHYQDFKSKKIEPNINLSKEDIIITSNRLALNRIINNLINNSLLHGKSYVGVSLYQEKDQIILVFENDVEEIEAIDIEKIFTRFYKKDTARTLNSIGLGLAIIKELVESIDGEMTASLEEDLFKIDIRL